MGPPRLIGDVQYRVARHHPLRPVVRRVLERLERASAGEIRHYQERRLRMLVRLAAARSPFYRDWFARSGVSPAAVRTIDDLALLPFVERSDLAARPDGFRTLPGPLMWRARSSGTSGTPVTVYRTPGSAVREAATLERQWSWFDIPRDPRRAVLRGGTFAADPASPPTTEVPAARRLLVSSYRLSAGDLPAIVDALRGFDPDVVEGWPSSLVRLAGLLQDAGRTLPVRAVITSSETLSAAQIALMHEVYAGPIVDHYGQTERVAMAGSCEAGSYHLFPDYGITEFRPVPGVEHRWEIVGTPLNNPGFPLFRYRTGDEVGPAPEGACPCGRPFPRLGRVDGRREDAFTTSDGQYVPLPATLIDNLSGLREAQVRQRAPGLFDVLLVPGPGYDRTAVRDEIHRTARALFRVEQQIRVQEVDRVPRTAAGKLKAAVIVDDLVANR